MSAPLPPAARRMIAATFVSSLGTGFTLPYTLILLHEVRHIALPTVGLLLAIPGLVGVAAVPFSGAMVDRFGPRQVLRVIIVFAAASQLLLAFCSSRPLIVLGMVLLGLGLGPSFPAASALLNGLVAGEQVERAFGVNFTGINAAIGIGGILGAAIVDVHHAGTFTALYAANALTFVAQWLLLPPSAPVVASTEEEGVPSYREVLADPVLRRVVIVSLLLAFTGYAALDSGLPAYARVIGHVSPSVIGIAFAVNTAVIVAGQLALLRLIRGRRRSLFLGATAAVWALSWAVLGLVPGLSGSARIAVVLLFGGVFGLGECLMAPTLQPLVNALATDRLRGRYNALSGAAFSIAFVVSPAISGGLIGNGHAQLWLGLVVVGALVAATVAVQLRGQLSDEQDGLVRALAPS